MSSEEGRAELSTEKSALLIVEDDPDILEQMRWGLGANHLFTRRRTDARPWP